MSDSPAAGNPASTIPEEAGRAALDAALTATAPLWGDVQEHWRVRILSAALKAAEPLMAADLERAVQRAEVLVAERDRQWAEALLENERLRRAVADRNADIGWLGGMPDD